MAEGELMRAILISLFASGLCFGQAGGIGKAGGTGNQLFPANAQTSTYQTIQSDWQFCKTIPVASGTFTITLLSSTLQPKSGQCIRIINYGSGVVTVAPSGQNINGSGSSFILAAGAAATPTGLFVTSDGTNYEAQPFVSVAISSACQPGGTSTDILTDNGSGGCNSNANAQLTSGGILSKYDGLTSVGLGVPFLGWQSVLTNSSATSAVILATSPAAGDYEIHYSLDLHTPCTTGVGELTLAFSWTGNSARTITSGGWPLQASQTAAGGEFSGILPIHVVSGNVTYTPALTTACATGTATWDGNIWMVRVN
jgi:hypothetical protein